MKKITYCQAINQALIQEMERDNSVFVYGIGVPDHKNVFGSTEELQDRFGSSRVFDTPLSEDALTGFGIGAAMNGLRPVQIHIRADFALLAMNQIINMMSSIEYMSNGQLKCPIVIRIIIGRGWGQGFQHSKSLFSLFTHIPGLTVIAPSNPADMKGMLTKAIRMDSPVICFEHRWLYWQENYIIPQAYETPFNCSLYNGLYHNTANITFISYSWGTAECHKAAEILFQKHNITADVIDLKVLNDLDIERIIKFIHCDTCIIVEDDWSSNSVGASLLAKYMDIGGGLKDFSRIGWKNTPCPTARHLENDFYYDVKDIVRKAEERLGLEKADLSDVELYTHENKFKGPF